MEPQISRQRWVLARLVMGALLALGGCATASSQPWYGLTPTGGVTAGTGQAATSGGQRAAGSGPRVAGRPARGKCLDWRAVSARTREIERGNDAALAAALRAAGLERIKLPATTAEIAGQRIYPGNELRPEWREFSEDGQSKLAGPVVRFDCPRDQDRKRPSPAFVMAADRTVFRLEPVPKHGKTASIHACGCRPRSSLPCGAYMPGIMQPIYTLPAGSRYGGVKKVTYRATNVSTRYEKSGIRDCPPPPNPP